MKQKLTALLLVLACLFACSSCALTPSGDMPSGAENGSCDDTGASPSPSLFPSMREKSVSKSDGKPMTEYPDGETEMFMEEMKGIEGKTEESYGAGTITASAWDDNRYYSMWQELFLQGQTEKENGKFFGYAGDEWKMFSRERVTVTVKKEEAPVAGAVVSAYADEDLLYTAVTDANGVARLFTSAEEGSIRVTSGTDSAQAEFTADLREVGVSLTSPAEKKNIIQLMFVVDVTGSMGDELEFLKTELGDVIDRVAKANTDATVSLGFFFYRDEGDDTEFCYVDFRDVTDPEDYRIQQGELAKQAATGGGDYPEAVDEALALAVEKQWYENATKMIFLVLDAPAHEKEENKVTYSGAVKAAAAKGIRICPVLASGADTLTEYLTRSAAILTGGTFVFITDDSGVGGGHLDPNIPNTVVERLNLLLVRLINGYHTGSFADPIPWNAKPAE